MPNQVIPVIDIAPLKRRNGQRKDTIDQIREACRDWGFFHITGHDLSPDLLSRVWQETKQFFALPTETKNAVARTKDNARGWFNRELTKNTRDMKEVFDFGGIPHPELPDNDPANWTRDGLNQWPKTSLCPAFKATMWEYFIACERVALTILGAVGEGLGVPGDCVTRDFQTNHTSFLRLNFFPKHDPLDAELQASTTGHLGIHHHTDAGALTLLLQDDVGGLQVCHHGEWIHIEPRESALVVNIGDMVQVWSNDLYQAPLHRVLVSENRKRHSLPFFYNPSYEAVYAPLENLTSEASPPHYRPINWDEFRWKRQQGDYANYGQENQISDYRIP